ncbi:unnamed protein product [Polarella glacialis]|uniref:Uncharacterized protein n=1 Tax=Polarella glacialis TaxID=89957 RepID=A0A813JCX3_POLGL|nr:unnamed protein product [Polarella glacialis]
MHISFVHSHNPQSLIKKHRQRRGKLKQRGVTGNTKGEVGDEILLFLLLLLFKLLLVIIVLLLIILLLFLLLLITLLLNPLSTRSYHHPPPVFSYELRRILLCSPDHPARRLTP